MFYMSLELDMDTLTQLLMLPEENIGTPDVTILPESYPIRSRPGEYVDIIIVGSTFFGMELVETQQCPLVSQCSGKYLFIHSFMEISCKSKLYKIQILKTVLDAVFLKEG